MKRRFLRCLSLLAVFALLLPPAAKGELLWLEIPGEEASICLPSGEKYTIVTPDTLKDNMELCLAHGGTAEDARQRFSTGHVIWEAYRPDVDGRFRLEVYEDEWTHYVWDIEKIGNQQFNSLADELMEADWLGDRYHIFKLHKLYRNDMRWLYGSFTSQLPFAYESGMVKIFFYNGKAFIFLYADSKPASKEAYLEHDTILLMWQINSYGYFRRDSKALANAPHRVDLLPDWKLLPLNLHPGALTFRGRTEKGASVTLETGDQIAEAEIRDRDYEGSVDLAEGENRVVIRARKGEQPENVIETQLNVDSSMAALALTQWLYDYVDRDDLKIKGFTDPAGTVTVTVDGGDPIQAEIREDGTFEVAVEAEDWVHHTLEITASQEGLSDCTARFSFVPTYMDAEKGIRAFRKTIEETISAKMLLENPGGYVGKRCSYYVLVQGWSVHDGMITLEARPEDRNGAKVDDPGILLIFDNYMEDFFSPGMLVTIYGEILEPSLTEQPKPRIEVFYTELVTRRSNW